VPGCDPLLVKSFCIGLYLKEMCWIGPSPNGA
jgi:hypothetical protein